MAHSSAKDLDKPLKMATIVGYPNAMLKEINKWLPKFFGNNVITAEQHLHAISRDMENEGVEHCNVPFQIGAPREEA
jgi:hypothetical protein